MSAPEAAMSSKVIVCGGKQPPPCKHDLSRMDPWWRERHDCASQDAFDAEQARLRERHEQGVWGATSDDDRRRLTRARRRQ